jgi:pimeloyl-ACP methyl ester carboxylesterase
MSTTRPDTASAVRPAPGASRLLALGAGAAVAALGAAALVRAKSHAAERAHPPRGVFVETDGVRLHVRDMGARHGVPLVLLHGMGAMGFGFEISRLPRIAVSRGYRVVVPDRPGYGWSERPRAREPWTPEAQARLVRGLLRELLGSTPAIVLGHSWGALVAIALALDAPEAVRGLVLEGGYYFPAPRHDTLLVASPAVSWAGTAWRHTFGPLALRASWPWVARRLFAPAPVTRAFRRRFPVWLALRPSQLRAVGLESAALIAATLRLRRRYADLRVPLSIVAGSGDRMVDSERHSARLARLLTAGRVTWIEGAGHLAHESAPVRVMAAIDAMTLGDAIAAAAREQVEA